MSPEKAGVLVVKHERGFVSSDHDTSIAMSGTDVSRSSAHELLHWLTTRPTPAGL